MRIALVLLFLLALGSVPGSMLPQEGADPAGVQQYYTSHPALAPLLNHLGLFNVFAAPWFAAIYLLLFASLVGCVVPADVPAGGLGPRRSRRGHRATWPGCRARPSTPPRWPRPRRPRWRRRSWPATASGSAGPPMPARHWLSAEKGYLREVGNLLFHLALLGVLVSVALGGLFGYKADRLLVQGTTFADTPERAGRVLPRPARRPPPTSGPFTITLNRFDASYITSGAQRGQPASFDAQISYTAHPGGPVRTDHLEVNRPLSVDGAKVYLIGHGYAPVFKVTDARGQVVYDQPRRSSPAPRGTSSPRAW